MSKKSSKNKKKWLNSTIEEAIVPHLPTKIQKSVDLNRDLTCLGTIKSWLTSSTRCIQTKHPQYPQLTLLSDSSRCEWHNHYHNGIISTKRSGIPFFPPPPLYEKISKLSHTFYCGLPVAPHHHYSSHADVTLSDIADPAIVVSSSIWKGRGEYVRRFLTYESTVIDPYDTSNQFMKFTNVVMSDDEKEIYALSTQGCLVVMESNEGRLTIKRKCGTRAVPTLNAKYFREYLFGSRGDIFLVFLIYQKGSAGVAENIEVFRLDELADRFDLVKVDRLDGRVLFLDKECCLWVDSEEIDCKGDCIYFRRGLGGNEGWWMYDMETRSISTACKKGTRGCFSRSGESAIEPVLFAP